MSQQPAATASRLLTCTRCLELIEVFEVPAPWLEPELYECGRCATNGHSPQLTLLPPGRYAPRRETPAYNPGQARIPF